MWGGEGRGWEPREPSPGWLKQGSESQATVGVRGVDVGPADLRGLSTGSRTEKWRRLEITVAKTGERSGLGKPSRDLGLC